MIRSLILLASLTVSALGFENNGLLTNAVINDRVFINNGSLEVQTGTTERSILWNYSQTPWESFSTEEFVNNGSIGGISMRFNWTHPTTLERRPATSFRNNAGAVIDAANLLESVSLSGFGGTVALIPGSSIRIQANSMVNEGLLRAGSSGLVMLRGGNADLSFGTLAIDPIGFFRGQSDICFTFPFLVDATTGAIVEYINPAGIYDNYWGMGNHTNLNVANFVQVTPGGTFVISPPHDVSFGGPNFPTTVFLTNAMSWGLLGQTDPTNYFVQAIFVQTSDPNVTAQAEWLNFAYPDGTRPIDKFFTAKVVLQAPLFDPVSLQNITNQIVILDQLATDTNLVILPELSRGAGTSGATGSRPATYWVSRCDPLPFFFGIQSNIVVSPGYFWDPSFSTPVVSNFYAGHSFFVDSLPSRPDPLPGVTVKDFPGRIDVEAAEVNLLRTGIRGEGLVSLVTDHLESTAGTIVDSQNLNFDLANRNGSLRVQNLSKDVVERLAGNVEMWSAIWTNTFTNVVGQVTNINTVGYHVFVVDAGQLTSKQEVSVADFRVRTPTTTLRIDDNMIVSNRFEIESRDLTVAGRIELRGSTWASTNLPNLRNFTTEDTARLQLMGLAQFGTAAQPLTLFTNAGTINAYSFLIDAEEVANSGLLFSAQRFSGFFFLDPTLPIVDLFLTNAGPISINARTSAILDAGELVTYGDITLSGPVFKFSDYTLFAGGAINLDVTGSLQDAGPVAPNRFIVSNAFNLRTPVAYGNLLGSTVIAQPARARAFRARWAAADLGATAAGFTTQAGIGRLVLNTDTNSYFEIRGTTPNDRAMYVDVLEIRGLGITNLTTFNFNFALANGIDFYYADVVAPQLEDDAARESKTVAEWLNGRTVTGGGTLRWVPTFVGDESSIEVARFGSNQSTRMNRALRFSLIEDTDGDGIPNGLDDFPLDNQLAPLVRVTSFAVTPTTTPRAVVTFTAQPGRTYIIQSAATLAPPSWNSVRTYFHQSATASDVTITDTAAATDQRRFYRVVMME